MNININLNEIIKKWKKDFLIFRISPAKHFNNLIILSFSLLICIVAYHGYIYYQIKYLDIQKSSEIYPAPVPTINNKKLSTILNKFDEKAKIQAGVLNLVPPIVDPSR